MVLLIILQVILQNEDLDVKIPIQGNCLTRLILHKQRFYCKHCNNTFIAETKLINKNKNISNNTNLQIRLELMEKQSENDVAKRMDVSVSFVDRILNDISSHTILRHPTLTRSLILKCSCLCAYETSLGKL